MAKPLVSFEIPYRLYMPDGMLPVKLGGKIYGVQIDYAPVGQVQNGFMVPSGPDVEYSCDVFGYAGRSLIHVIIPEDVDALSEEGKISICNKEDYYISEALSAINRVVEVYAQFDVNKMGAPSVHVLPIAKRYIANASIRVISDELKQIGEFAIMLPIGFRPVSQGDVIRPSDITNRIMHYLSNEKIVHIYRQLITGALGNLWRQVYRLVPIEASTAVEAFIPLAVEKIDSKANVSPELYAYDKFRMLESTINAKIGAEQKICWFSPGSKGWKQIQSVEIAEWHKDCYELRNKIIHRGYSSVTHEDAQNAINASTNLINSIMIILNKEFGIEIDY